MEKFEIEGSCYKVFNTQVGNLPLIIVRAKNGYIACNYIDKNTADKLGDVAAFVPGVKNMNDFLRAKIRDVTSWAEESYGIREGMSVKKALELMDKPPEKK
ncbi:MAG: DUF1805 domain-containing protein [Candidatus ainarchaeum sp.]|nr:DUF1805 domain-containing protein [Candidatus ainarchaeum sp.]